MSKRRILVVDDDHDCRLMLSSMMARAGFTVDAVADGDMAVSLMHASPPDLVLLDAHLPRRNGFEVCKVIKGDPSTSKTPVIMLTAFSADGARERSQEVGADEFIEKPFRRESLLEIMDRLFAVRARDAEPAPVDGAVADAVGGSEPK